MFLSKPVPHITTQDPRQLISSIRDRLPLQVTGLIENWPALKWTFPALSERFGKRQVKVLLDLPKAGGVLLGGQEAYESVMSFGAFVDRILKGPDAPCYLGYSRATSFLNEGDRAFDFSPLTISSDHPTDTRLWIGSAHTCSGLHSDLKDNIFAQIVGRKRVFLVPLNQTHLVYPFIDNLVNSQVDPEHFDAEKYPKFQKADVYSTVVGPGDVLFIPRGWWHYLRSEEPSISINHWFGPPVSAATYLGLLARLGPRYLLRTLQDMVRYGVLGQTYHKDFFFTPPSTGERLYNLIRYGDFSKENDPAKEGKKA